MTEEVWTIKITPTENVPETKRPQSQFEIHHAKFSPLGIS